MGQVKAYAPEQGYQHQILHKAANQKEYEHCDYAETDDDLDYLLAEYQLAYQGQGFVFKTITLPKKYWDGEKVNACYKARREKRKQLKTA